MSSFMSREMVHYYKQMYPEGTRIKLDYMDDPYAPIPSGTIGTVTAVDDAGNIHMKWDNGRSLAICPEVDGFHKIQEQELTEIQQEEIQEDLTQNEDLDMNMG